MKCVPERALTMSEGDGDLGDEMKCQLILITGVGGWGGMTEM